MGLPWIRLDTSMPDNPKVLRLLDERDGHRAVLVWIFCWTYAGKHGTDGFIPKNSMPFVHGRAADFARLVAEDALEVVPGGWSIPGWGEFQESNEASQMRRERAQRAAAKRWSKDEHASAARESRKR